MRNHTSGSGGARPRQDWSEAELLAAGFAANPATLTALQQRLSFSNADAAAACGVSTRTYRAWRAGANASPSALKLLAILAGYLPWDGWDGWEMHRGCLFPPGYQRGGIGPGEFHALIFYRQQVSAYRQEAQALRARLGYLESAAVSGAFR